MVTKNAAKPTVAAAKSKTRKVERKAMPAKSAARSTSAKKSPTSRKTATGKRTKTTSPAVETVAAAEPAKNATHVNAKIEFDAASRKITNHEAANALLRINEPPRKGWEEYFTV